MGHASVRPHLFNLVAGNFADPQQASQGATDLLCFDTNTNAGAIFATVREGKLDDGTVVQNGPRQVGGTIIADHRWTHVVHGPFGKSGAQVLFYDAHAGIGAFYGIQRNGNLRLIKTHTGWRTSWTQIISGKFSDNEGKQLLFYDAAAGTGEFYFVDDSGTHRRIRTRTGWRSSWHTILAANFSDSKFDDLLFYDKGAGVAEFYRADGHGGTSMFSSHASWRTSWRQIRAGAFEFGGRFSGLLFHEDDSGHTEIYSTNGKGRIAQLNVSLGSVWLARAANFQTIRPATFIGNTVGGLDDTAPMTPRLA